jgi:PAS domain S-box-containing protein
MSAYVDIFNKSLDGMIIVDFYGIIIDINNSMLQMFGYEKSTIIGQNINIFMTSPHKELHDAYLREFREHKRKIHIPSRKVPAIHKDGTQFFIELGIFEINESKCAGIVRDLRYLSDIEKQNIQEAEERNMFAANISHEFRTPLNVSINMNLLLKDEFDSVKNLLPSDVIERIEDYLDTVHHSDTLLLSQINDLLDYTKLMGQKLILRRDPYSVTDCIESTLKLHKQTAKNKNIELLFEIDSDVPSQVLGDSERLTQVLVNLVSNALKFTNEGCVKIKARSITEGNITTLYFLIIDSGIGISDENKTKLFQAFKQLDSSHTKRYGGTGLGLVICKKLCQLMGGDIILKESTFGKGSTFEFNIKVIETDENITLRKIDSSSLKGKQVLIVDDDMTNLQMLASYLIDWEMTPIMANSGEAALTYIKKNFKFDLALLDLRMPKMSGIELAVKMKSFHNVKYPILGISSIGVNIPGINVFDDLMEKPIIRDRLYRMIIKSLYNQNEVRKNVKTVSNTTSILVAEDNLDNQKVIAGLLKKLGYIDVDIVDDGDKALQKIRSKVKKYKILLLDIKMPVMSGLDVAKHINEDFKKKELDYKPVMIALTAVSSYGGKDFYIRDGGMDDYISKPIVGDTLRLTLAKYN